MKLINIVAVLVSALELSACGGSGGGSSSSSTGSGSPSAVSADAGGVSAPFVSAPYVTFAISGNLYLGFGNTFPVSQDGRGAMTTIGSYALTGTGSEIRDIRGDATFAMGRWVSGTVLEDGTTTRVTMNDPGNSASWDYVVTNPLASIPIGGSLTCDEGRFTTSMANVSNDVVSATTSGSATLTFSAGIADAAVSLQTVSGNAANVLSFSAMQFSSPTGQVEVGQLFDNGVAAMLGDAGGGAVYVVGAYSTQLSNGVGYKGVFLFKCS